MSTGKINIIFVLDCLQGGGAQRAVVNIINQLDRGIFHPSLVLIKSGGEFRSLLKTDIKIYELKSKSVKFSIFKLWWIIKISKPDVIFSTPSYVSSLLYVIKKFISKKIALVMRSSSYESVNMKSESLLARILMKRTYKSADTVVALTKAMKLDFVENFSVDENIIEIIPNMVDINYIKQESDLSLEEDFFKINSATPYMISVGRLSMEKGLDVLIKAFAIYRKKNSGKLVIVGTGPLKDELMKLAFDLGVSADVLFTGFQLNPYKYISKAKVFVLPSRWEGFPNALIEAMACSVPVIASDCNSGPGEIITNGLNGLLFKPEDTQELSSLMAEIMTDDKYCRELGSAAYKRAMDFKPDTIMDAYETLLKHYKRVESVNIVHVITSLNIGGTERFVQDIVSNSKLGYTHSVLYLKDLGILGRFLKSEGYSVLKASNFISLLFKIKRNKSDIIHTHLYRANIIGRLAGFILRIPVISSQRSIDIWKKKVYVVLDAITSHFCKYIVVNSKATSEILETRERVPSSKIKLLRTGLSKEWFSDNPKPKSSFRVGFVGRLHYNKGADYLLPLANYLKESAPDITLDIVGDGPMQQDLQMSLPANCRMLGWLEGNQLVDFYDSISLLVLLSREESFPRVILEAASRGVEAVAPDVGGIPEFIGKNSGFLYHVGDVQKAAYIIKDYVYKPETAIKLSDATRHLSRENMLTGLYSIYESILGLENKH